MRMLTWLSDICEEQSLEPVEDKAVIMRTHNRLNLHIDAV